MANQNNVTYSGRSGMWNRMKGNGTEFKNFGWGTGNGDTAAAKSDVNLFAPATEARVAATTTGVSTSGLADTYQWVGTIVAGGAKTITELGIFDTTTLSTTTTLVASLSAGGTTATFGANPGPTTGNYYLQIDNECLLVAGANSTTLTVTRAQLGSSAVAHAAAAPATIGGDGGANTTFALGGQTASITAALGGSMFIHSDFGGIALATNDSIAFTVTDTLT